MTQFAFFTFQPSLRLSRVPFFIYDDRILSHLLGRVVFLNLKLSEYLIYFILFVSLGILLIYIVYIDKLDLFAQFPFKCCPCSVLSDFVLFSYRLFHSFMNWFIVSSSSSVYIFSFFFFFTNISFVVVLGFIYVSLAVLSSDSFILN